MLELLRDPIWQFVGAALTLAAIVITIFIYIRQTQRREISCDTILFSQLLFIKAEESTLGKMKAFYDHEPVQSIHLLVLEFANSGNQPILPAEYQRPLEIVLMEPGHFLSAECGNMRNIDLEASITSPTTITIRPTLLNPGDSFIIKTMIADYKYARVDTHIIGVRTIAKRRLDLLILLCHFDAVHYGAWTNQFPKLQVNRCLN